MNEKEPIIQKAEKIVKQKINRDDTKDKKPFFQILNKKLRSENDETMDDYARNEFEQIKTEKEKRRWENHDWDNWKKLEEK